MNSKHFIACCLSIAVAASGAACSKPRANPAAPGAEEAAKEAFGKLGIDELETRMSDAKAGKIKLAVFDNNEHERFDKGHIPGATWVKFDAVKASDLPSDKETTLVFYCANEH